MTGVVVDVNLLVQVSMKMGNQEHGPQHGVTGVVVDSIVNINLLVQVFMKLGNHEHGRVFLLVHQPQFNLAYLFWEQLPALRRWLARQVFDVFKGRGDVTS